MSGPWDSARAGWKAYDTCLAKLRDEKKEKRAWIAATILGWMGAAILLLALALR